MCGMPVDPATDLVERRDGVGYRFCSEYCRARFRELPQPYVDRAAAAHDGLAGRRIAYFSMEIAIAADIPTYAGGLGVLAGDTLRAAADLHLPIVAVTLLFRDGYFRQALDADGRQHEQPALWRPDAKLRRETARAQVEIEGRIVHVAAWRLDVEGARGLVPVFFLDTDLPENSAWDRRITRVLYGGDAWHRLAQEVVLGIGGLRILRALGCTGLSKLHLNEGHAAFAAWELLREQQAERAEAFASVRRTCVFTTHTPVPAGHDQFPTDVVRRMLGPDLIDERLGMLAGRETVNMTRLALNLSGFANGVTVRHEHVADEMFPGYGIRHVTNGVHVPTWACEPMRDLFDHDIPGWRADPALLRHALGTNVDDLWAAHAAARETLFALVKRLVGRELDPARLTLGFGRRAATYKRLEFMFEDLGRLRRLGPLQVVFAGKAHPDDGPAKDAIARVHAWARQLGEDVPVVWVPDYEMEIAARMVAGVDVWLNTPLPPLEASGTSGMKAACNGVPCLSTPDGWWLEGHLEGLTGWVVERPSDLYDKLERLVLPAFRDRARWGAIMAHCIAINASFFNTHRMLQQYATAAYL